LPTASRSQALTQARLGTLPALVLYGTGHLGDLGASGLAEHGQQDELTAGREPLGDACLAGGQVEPQFADLAAQVPCTSTRLSSHRHHQPASDIVGLVTDWRIVISDTASATDQTALRDALNEFNYTATGYRDGGALSCFLRKKGMLAAGIDGFSWGGYARIEYLWVAEGHRGQGLGTQLLAAAEAEARRRGCETIVLDSHSFQAPDFYRRRGYREIGTTTDTPRGFTQTLFQKSL
jgi:GNAT superfamily N-acetyltransferase